MSTTIASLALVLAIGTAGQCPNCGQNHRAVGPGIAFVGLGGGGRIMPDGPGNGWGFPNGNPDGYGYVDYGTFLPLGANRTGEYYFPRYFAAPPSQLFMPTYYNPYFTRGQRYIAFAGAGGDHPMGGPPIASAALPTNPYNETLGNGPACDGPSVHGPDRGSAGKHGWDRFGSLIGGMESLPIQRVSSNIHTLRTAPRVDVRPGQLCSYREGARGKF